MEAQGRSTKNENEGSRDSRNSERDAGRQEGYAVCFDVAFIWISLMYGTPIPGISTCCFYHAVVAADLGILAYSQRGHVP